MLVQVSTSDSGCTLQAVWNILLGHKTAVWDVYTLHTERWRGFPRPCIWLTKQHQVKILSSWSPSPKVSGAMVRASLELFLFAILCVRCHSGIQAPGMWNIEAEVQKNCFIHRQHLKMAKMQWSDINSRNKTVNWVSAENHSVPASYVCYISS